MQKSMRRKKYDKNYKCAAVGYFMKNGGTISDVANRFGITPGMLHKWTSKYGDQCESPSQDDDKACRSIAMLSKEVSRIKHDVEVLRSLVRTKFSDRIHSLTASDILKSIVDK